MNKVNGKSYVGITSADKVARRWNDHKLAAVNNKPFVLSQAINKHGVESFTITIIACARTWDDLCVLERILIQQHNTFWSNGFGYNMTTGGEGFPGVIRTPEWKKQIGEANRRRGCKEETKAKISAANKGRRNTVEQLAARKGLGLGRKHSPAVCAARSLARKGLIVPEYVRHKISLACIGRKHTPESKAKMSAARKGVPHSPEHSAKISAALKLRGIRLRKVS